MSPDRLAELMCEHNQLVADSGDPVNPAPPLDQFVAEPPEPQLFEHARSIRQKAWDEGHEAESGTVNPHRRADG